MHIKWSFLILLEIVLMIVGAFCLWFRVLLPIAYYLVAILISTLTVIQLFKRSNSRLVLIQIFLLLLFTNNIYNFYTRYQIIPFGDANWDCAAEKIYNQTGMFSVIDPSKPINFPGVYQPASILKWYTEWPILHVLAFSLSKISGLDVFYIALILPQIISVTSFLFVYLLVERLRISLQLNVMTRNLALVLYVASAEALFYPTQFVQQNFGMFLFFAVIYLLYLSHTVPINSIKYKAICIVFAATLAVAHHFTAFTLASFLFLFYLLQLIGKYLSGTNITRKYILFPYLSESLTLGLAFLTSIFMFLWWDNFGTIIWRFTDSVLTRFIQTLMGIRKFEYAPPVGYYPEVLKPLWAMVLLRFRDVVVYLPSLAGIFLIIFYRKKKTPHESFLILASFSLGLLFIINNFTIRIQMFRLFILALPLIVLLSASFFTFFTDKYKGLKSKLILNIILLILIFTAFVGLWGHEFALVHVYDTSVKASDIGERNFDYIRVGEFFNQRVNATNYQTIWVDDDAALVWLLQPDNYYKILRLWPEYFAVQQSTNKPKNELICSFRDLNMYCYFAGASLRIKTLEEAKVLRDEFYNYFEGRFNRIYDDGKYIFWMSDFID